MKISIITPCYNAAETIEDTLKSIIHQTYTDYEVIIVDGGSADSTVQLAEKYQELVKGKITLISEPDDGIFDAMNKGIKMASGDIISLLNADDEYASDDILKIINDSFEQNSVDGVYGDLVYVNRKNTNKVIRYWKAGVFKRRKLYFGWTAPHLSLFLKKDVYEKYGYFDKSFKIAADYDIMLRFIAVHRIRLFYISKVLVKMKIGGVSNHGIKNLIRKSREDIRALRKNHFGSCFVVFFKIIRKLKQYLRKRKLSHE